MTYGGSVTANSGVATRFQTAHAACFTITARAVHGGNTVNTAVLYLGGSNVDSSHGIPLNPGESFTFPPMESNSYNVEDQYFNPTSSGDGVAFIYSVR